MLSSNLSKKEISIVLIALILIGTGCYIFNQDSFSSLQKNHIHKIGQYKIASGATVKRGASQIEWRQISHKQELQTGDYLLTQEQSSGIVELDDGTILEMGPKTLISLENINRDVINIKLHKGLVKVKKSILKKIRIRHKKTDQVILPTADPVAITIKENGVIEKITLAPPAVDQPVIEAVPVAEITKTLSIPSKDKKQPILSRTHNIIPTPKPSTKGITTKKKAIQIPTKQQLSQAKNRLNRKPASKSSKAVDIKNAPAKIPPEKSLSEQFKTNIFYMASLGRFSQKIGSSEADFSQNSPLSLGIFHAFSLPGGHWQLPASIYFSYLQGASNNLNDETIEISPEIGATLYLTKSNPSGFYAGLDIEQFSIFNLEQMQNTGETTLMRQQLSYVTIGYQTQLQLMQKLFHLKTSLSQSVLSQSPESVENLQGFKYMLFLTTSLNSKISLNTLFKHHQLSDLSQLSSSRYGLGLSYKF